MFSVHTCKHTQYYLDAMSVDLLHCSHSDQTRTSLVHSLQFHLRLEAVGRTLQTEDVRFYLFFMPFTRDLMLKKIIAHS